jgi:hypothetical protein
VFWRTVVRASDDNTPVLDQGPWASVLEMIAETTRVLATGASWSGHERNHLFFGGLPGHQFERLSGISGLDDPGDSRAFATLDFDRDGWLDVVLGNVSAPRARLLRNEIGSRRSASGNGFLALRFVGGNTTSTPDSDWSSRDGLGARVTVDLGPAGQIHREHRLDDGFKAQHSATMIIGIGPRDRIDAVRVQWPSGRNQTTTDIASGTLLTTYEDSSASPTGHPFVPEKYGSDPTAPAEDWRESFLPSEPSRSIVTLGQDRSADLVLYLGVATWCVTCAAEIPELRVLRAAMKPDELAMVGVPIDPRETPEQLQAWVGRYDPPYEMAEPSSVALEDFKAVVKSELRQTERLPLSIVTDTEGHVLLARWGIPTLSELRALRGAARQ